MANLGYVGLGVMGGRMADRLLSKGHTVIGYNRTRDKDRKSTRLNSSHIQKSRMPSSA